MPKHYAIRLVAALRAGHGAERLYEEYGIALFGYCWALLGERAEAAGALTDTVLVASAHADALADPGDLTPWVFALARAECRRRQTDVPPLVSPYQCDPDADVVTLLVARALADVRPADRELVDLTVRYGLAGRDLARVIGEDDERAAGRAEIAVTRFDQTLTTLFMASPGRLAVPREIIADRPPLRVLLGLLPPARPPGELRGNIAAACLDPALEHYRQMVARRALPLREDGFPRAPHPERGAALGSYGLGTRPGPYGLGTPRASYGTAAMPLAAPVGPPGAGPPGGGPPEEGRPEDGPADRRAGGRSGIGPVDPDLIPAEAVSRARTNAPAPDPVEAGEPVRQPAEHADQPPPDRARPRRGRRRPRPSPIRRFARAVGVVVAVMAVVGAVWAAGQILAATRAPGPRVTPAGTTSGGRGVPVPASRSPSKRAGTSPARTGPARTGPPAHGRTRHHRSGRAGSPVGVGVDTVAPARRVPPRVRHSASPTHRTTTPAATPTPSPTRKGG